MPQSKRNLLLTKTAIGIYISFCSTLVAVAPNIENLISRGKTELDKANIRDVTVIAVAAIGAIGGAIGSFAGRYHAGGTYTPKYLPGENPPERLQ